MGSKNKLFYSLQTNNKLVLLLLVVFFVAVIVSRFFRLGSFPVSLTHDEIVYALQAKSFAVQGTTANQQLKPWSLMPVHPWYAELPAVIMAPFFLLTDNPLLATHLLPAVMSTLFPLVMAAFVYQIWKNTRLSIAAAVVTGVSPLWWQFGRLAYDSVFTTFFYFLGGALFLSKKNRYVYLSSIFFAIGFFGYQGLKLVLIPWVFGLYLIKFGWPPLPSIKKIKTWPDALSSYFKLTNSTASLSVVSAILILFFGYIFILLPNQNTDGRLKSALLGDQVKISQLVDSDRRLSFQTSYNSIFNNKLTKNGQLLIKRGLKAFSPMMLLMDGEPGASGFATWGHGFFYLIDGLLIGVGIFAALTTKKKTWPGQVLLLLIPISAVAVFINASGEWYLLRSFMAYTLLLIFASWGLYAVFKTNFKWLIGPIYVLSVIWFTNHYYNQYPVYSADADLFAERVMFEYISRLKNDSPDQKITVYTIDPPIMFASFLVHTNLMTTKNADLIAQAINAENYNWNGITFKSDCIDLRNKNMVNIAEYLVLPCSEDVLADRPVTSNEPAEIDEITTTTNPDYNKIMDTKDNNRLYISAVLDSGAKYHLYHDRYCQQFELNTYTRVQQIDDFRLSKQSPAEFCFKWITDLSEFGK